MARHSSITRSTLYTMPSNVQLVSISILTRSSLPTARRASSLDLISRSGTPPYIENSWSG